MAYNIQQAIDEGQLVPIQDRIELDDFDSVVEFLSSGEIDLMDIENNIVYIVDGNDEEMYGYMSAEIDLNDFDNDENPVEYALGAISAPGTGAPGRMGQLVTEQVAELVMDESDNFYIVIM